MLMIEKNNFGIIFPIGDYRLRYTPDGKSVECMSESDECLSDILTDTHRLFYRIPNIFYFYLK